MRPLTTLLVAMAVALTGASGCLDEPAGPAPSPGEDAYWMIHVHGSQHEEPPPRIACDLRFDHAVHAEAQAVTFEPSVYDFDPARVDVLIAFDHFQERSDCPFAYTLAVNASRVEEDMGGFGTLVLDVAEDGSVLVNGEDRVQPGDAREYAYENSSRERRGTVNATGSFTVTHHGAWPVDGLRPGGPGGPA